VRAILDEECARGVDARTIERAVTRREAAAIWALTGLARRASILQRYLLYTNEPDGLEAELARYRTVTVASVEAARSRWIGAFVEIESVPRGDSPSGTSSGAPAT